MMCQNYEKQLQRLQREHLDLKDKKDALMTFAKKEKVKKSVLILEMRIPLFGRVICMPDVMNVS